MTGSLSIKTTLSAGALALAMAFGASAQTGAASSAPASTKASPAATQKAANPDAAFARKAAMGGMAEVELGNLAQQKASSADVKNFASRMVQDHGKANDELKQIASRKGIDLPTALDKPHQNDKERLGKLSGAEFDRAYMKHMVDDHKKDVADFKKAADSAKDSDIKGFAAKTLPTLEEHLKLAQKTHDGLQAAAATTGMQKSSPKVKKGGC